MSKSPVYIGAGASELAVQAALNLIQDGVDSSQYLVTIADWVHLTDGTTVIDRITSTDSLKYSAKEYAQGTNASTGGSSKSWSQDTDGVNGAGANDRSAKAWSQGASMTGSTLGGSSKDWAILAEDSVVDGGTGYSALHHAAKAAADLVLTNADVVLTNADVVTVEGIYDNFDDRYLGAHTTAEREVGAANIGKDHDGSALVDGALYYDTTLNVMKVWNLGTTTWDQTLPTASSQTQINTLTQGYDGTTSTTPGTNLNIVQVDVVADNIASVNTVATNVADVVTVANDLNEAISEIETAALDLQEATSEIDTVAVNIANVNIVGTDIANVNTVAGKATEIGRLGTVDAVADMALLGLAPVITDMDLLGATGVIGDIEIVSDNITDVNNFADQYQIHSFSPSDPTTDGSGNALAAGDLAFDTTENGLKVWTGSTWSGTINTTEGVIVKKEYTANGSTQHYILDHDQDMEIVYLNGVKLLAGDGSNNNDYFSVSGGSSTTYIGDGNTATHIYFHTAPTNTFVISVVAWGASNNSLAVAKTGGTYSGLVTFAAGLVTTTADINGGTLGGITIDGNWTAASQTCADLGTVTTGAFTTITNLGNVTTTGTVGLGGKLTAGSNEIEGSNFDIDGGDISASTISGGLTWSASQDLNGQNLTNVNIDSGDISSASISGGLTWSADQDFNHRNLTNIDIDSGAIDGTVIGGASPQAGTFTTINGTEINANIATNNIGIGTTALNSVTSGDYNVALGAAALTAVIGTNNSVAIGHQTLEDNTAAECTAVGGAAMRENVGGTGNTGIGFQASALNVSGLNNTSVGYKTLYNNTGSANTAIGWAALHNNTADLNTAVGYAALYTHTTGAFCTAVGYEALSLSNTNDSNTAIGYQALKDCVIGSGAQTGAKNVALGAAALKGCTDGYQNTAVGYLAGHQMAGGRDNVAIGYGAMYAGTGNLNTCIGWQSGVSLTTGGTNLLVGSYSGTNLSPSGTITTGSGLGCWGDNWTGTTNGNYIQTDWTVVSDERDKADITPMTHGLDFIENITPINYFWDIRTHYWDISDIDNIIENEGDGSKKIADNPRIGFSAQKVKTVLDTIGYTGHAVVDSRDEENLKITNNSIIPFLVNAVKELSAKVKVLEAA